MEHTSDLGSASRVVPVHRFYLAASVLAAEQCRLAVKCWRNGESVEYHAHRFPQNTSEQQSQPCSGGKFVVVVEDLKTGQVRAPQDLCWRLS